MVRQLKLRFHQLNWGMVVASVAMICAVLISVTGIVVMVPHSEDATRTGKERQRHLMLLQEQLTTELRFCLDSQKTDIEVALEEVPAIRKAVSATVWTRYVIGVKAQTSSNITRMGVQKAFMLLQRQYPQVGMTAWRHLAVSIVTCRNRVEYAQAEVQREAVAFNAWRHGGGLFERAARLDFPNSDLIVTDPVSSGEAYGSAALDLLLKSSRVDGDTVPAVIAASMSSL